MRASFIISEVLTGLRRNVTMTIAMILTTAVSLATLGGGLLFVRMIDKTQEIYKDSLEVGVFLVKEVSADDPECAKDPCRDLRADLDRNPAIESVVFENREAALARFKRVFEAQPEMIKLVRLETLPASFRVKLKNPDRPEVIEQTYNGRPGVDNVVDQSEFLARFFSLLNMVRNLAFFVALVMAIAALLLISNTVQVSAFTRRTEVGIMRLVGATRWYTQLPFLLEAVTTGIIGAVLAIGMLALFKSFFLDNVVGGVVNAGVIGSIDTVDILLVSPWLLLTAIAISAVTGYATLRLYVRT
jgi:cell division transport system permease protein